MAKPFKGTINLDVRDSTPDWGPYEQPKAPDGAPNVLFIVWDDTGFGALSPFGGPIEMPTMQRLADDGLKYTQFHTTAICSPTRASMLTGRNHTTVGMACIAEATTGFPGLERPHPVRDRDDRRGARRARLQHLHVRQVALRAGGRDEHGFLEAQLADRPWFRALLRVPRRRDERVVPGPGPGSAVRRPAVRPAEGREEWAEGLGDKYHLSKDLADRGDRDDRRRQAGRAREAVLHVLLPGREPRAASLAEGVGGQVQGQVRRRATRRSARRSSPTRRRWGSSRRTPSCRRSTRWPA